jgi:hypothetical protein
VRALLGEPDRVAESGAFAYDLSVGAVLPDPADLLVRFEGGAVVAASVEPR